MCAYRGDGTGNASVNAQMDLAGAEGDGFARPELDEQTTPFVHPPYKPRPFADG